MRIVLTELDINNLDKFSNDQEHSTKSWWSWGQPDADWVVRSVKENFHLVMMLCNSREENEQVIFGTQCLCLCGRTDSISRLLFLRAKLARRLHWIKVSPYLLSESEVFHCTNTKKKGKQASPLCYTMKLKSSGEGGGQFFPERFLN